MRVYEKAMKGVGQEWENTKLVLKRLTEFIQASCLAGVSGFAIWQAWHVLETRNDFWYRLLLFAGLIIAVEAARLYLKHFKGESHAPNFNPSVPLSK